MKNHVHIEPEYYLWRCTGSVFETRDDADFALQGMPTDRQVVISGLRAASADPALIASVEAGDDVNPSTDAGREIIAVLKMHLTPGPPTEEGGD
jgi:hypothetical protein